MDTATPQPDTTSSLNPNEINTVSFVSLGCPKNLVDSEAMLGLLAADGVAPVSAIAEPDLEHDDLSLAGSEQDSSASSGRITPADAVVINTCGFLEASKQESLGVIQEALEAKKRGEIKRVVVAGCLVQRHRAKMFEWAPGIDAMVGVFDRDKIIEAVRGPLAQRTTLGEASDNPTYWISSNAMTKAKSEGMDVAGKTVQGKDGKGLGYFEKDNARLRLTPRHYAYLRISEGCNQNCTFCTIPSIRGKMRSKNPDQIVEEARELMRDGAFEMLLIGQDTTSYGDDIGLGLGQTQDSSTFGAGLPSLLKQLSDASKEELGTAWLRLMYAYPTTFTDSTIDAFAELVAGDGGGGNLLPYLDIPLQHASDSVLAAMRRHVTRAQQAELCHKLRDRVPGMAIRTTFITGFPGETESDHQQLLEFIEEIEFDAVGCFQYSMEEGTVAGRQELDPALVVDAETKQRRHDELLALQQRIAFEQAQFVAQQFDPTDPGGSGQQFDILIDNVSGKELEGEGVVKGAAGAKLYQGRGYFQAPQIDAVTYVQSRAPLSPGELVRCTIVASDGYDLIARPQAELTSGFSLPIL